MYLFVDWCRSVVYRAGVASRSGAHACVSVEPVRRWWRATRRRRTMRRAAWRIAAGSGCHPLGLIGWSYYPLVGLYLFIGPVTFSVVRLRDGIGPFARWRFPRSR